MSKGGKDLLLPLFRSDYLFDTQIFPRVTVEWDDPDREKFQEGCPAWIKETGEKTALRDQEPDVYFMGAYHQMRDFDRFLEQLSKLDSLENITLLKARRCGYVDIRFKKMLEESIKMKNK